MHTRLQRSICNSQVSHAQEGCLESLEEGEAQTPKPESARSQRIQTRLHQIVLTHRAGTRNHDAVSDEGAADSPLYKQLANFAFAALQVSHVPRYKEWSTVDLHKVRQAAKQMSELQGCLFQLHESCDLTIDRYACLVLLHCQARLQEAKPSEQNLH